MFKKYMHIERYGNDEVQGIEIGQCFIFPKIDGTNGSVWYEDGTLRVGSRNREITVEDDNQGFAKYVTETEIGDKFLDFFAAAPLRTDLRLFGEWLVPHSLKTYHDEAWRKFYIFDVYDDNNNRYLNYNEYKPLIEACGLDYIPAMTVLKNATYDNLLKEVNDNVFLIKDGCGHGEGIVIKNYEFTNKYGRTVFAKIITNKFKEKHSRTMGPTEKKLKEQIEHKIVEKYVDDHLINKVFSKITNEMGGWNSKYIPRLLGTVYHDLITEEIWDIIKKMKYPTIDFKRLNGMTIQKIKEIKPELF